MLSILPAPDRPMIGFQCIPAIRSLALISLLSYPVITPAGMYKWVDEEGIIQYSDTPPASQPTLEIRGNISSYTSPSVEKIPDGFLDKAKPDGVKRVVMYSAAWCGVCKQAKSYFQRKNINFTEYDIDKSERARKEFDKLNGTGVPVILVGKNRLNGFSAQRFDAIYYN